VRHSRRLIAIGVICAAMIASVATYASGSVGTHGGGTDPGITKTQVNVGAIVTQSGSLAADFAPYLSGVHAYFDYVNAKGGINHRQLNLADALDDQSLPATDVQDARTLVTADHVFAIVGISVPFFQASSYLSTQPTPVFGYSTSNVWAKTPTFFADYGSYLNYNSSIPDFAYVAKKTGVTKIAVVALGYPSSKDECEGAIDGLKAFKFKVAYSNVNESIDQDWSVEATKIKRSGAKMVVSCMDDLSSIQLSKNMASDGLNPVQLWLDGYDRTVLQANSQYMQGVYLLLQHVPFEAATTYPTTYPGLNLYLSTMVKYGYTSDEYSDVALAGWESASLFAQGLKSAGTHPTQQAVTAAINKITNDTGGGVAAPTDWKIAHTSDGSPSCETFVKVVNTNFTLAFNKGSDPWVCFPLKGTINLSKPVAPPRGTPGA
jgi:branched-chain amino acid transport system substrate-binding protein